MSDNVSEPTITKITWRIDVHLGSYPIPHWRPAENGKFGNEQEARWHYEDAKREHDRVRLVRVEETTVEID